MKVNEILRWGMSGRYDCPARSLREHSLEVGAEVLAAFKSTEVMLATVA